MLREVVAVREPARFAVVKKGKMENMAMGWWNRYVCGFECPPFQCKFAMLPPHAPCFALLEMACEKKRSGGNKSREMELARQDETRRDEMR